MFLDINVSNMMKGKLMKSLFRGKAVPRTPGPPGSEASEDGEAEAERVARLRVHSEENNSNHSLDSPSSDSPRSWPSTFATPMSYIKGKKRKNSRFLITSPLELDKEKGFQQNKKTAFFLQFLLLLFSIQ